MSFPLFFLTILGAIIIFALIVAVYFQVYKKNINRSLQAEKQIMHVMVPPYKVLILAAILVLISTTIAGYFVGYKTAYDRMENGTPVQDTETFSIPQTFYAEITAITGSLENGNAVHIRGLAVNDIHFRGDFSFSVFGETIIEWHETPLEFSDLEIGDIISVTFIGEIQETSPAIINHVVRIQLLDDAK